MARNTPVKKNTHSSKKQRLGSVSPKKRTAASTKGLSKARKRVLVRQISASLSETSSRGGRRQNAPTFHQPQSPDHDSESVGRHSGHSTVRKHGDVDEDLESDEDDEGVEEVLKHPKNRRHKLIGKMFTLKAWPWPSSNWWIGDEEPAVAVSEKASKNMKEKLAAAKKKLDAIKKEELAAFLVIDMGMSEEEWMTAEFRSSVTIPNTCCPTTDFNDHDLVVSARGTVTPVRDCWSFEEQRTFDLPDH